MSKKSSYATARVASLLATAARREVEQEAASVVKLTQYDVITAASEVATARQGEIARLEKKLDEALAWAGRLPVGSDRRRVGSTTNLIEIYG